MRTGRRRGGAADADDRIGFAVYTLHGWGFKLSPAARASFPDGVFEAVASAAREVLNRTDSVGSRSALSKNRIEQIYSDWLKAQWRLWDAWMASEREYGEPFKWPPRLWEQFTRRSRSEQIPPPLRNRPLPKLAEMLLRGTYDAEEWAEWRRPPLEEAKEFLRFSREEMPMPARVRAGYNWRKKRGRPKKKRVP